MSKTYVEKNVDEIAKKKDYEYPQNMAMASAWILADLKGVNLKVIDVQNSSSLSDYYILASANNSTQARSMADEIVTQLTRLGVQINSVEGAEVAEWILIDAGDIIIHIFNEYLRPVYDLDSLWKDAPLLDIPQDFYFSRPQAETESDNDGDKGYF